jgi:hypothetical protein
MKNILFLGACCIFSISAQQSAPVSSTDATNTVQADPQATTPNHTTEQDRKIDILSQEVEKLKAGHELFPAVKATGKFGLGPAASKVYDVQQGVSIGGYGEILYQRFDRSNQSGTDVSNTKTDQFDFVRAIVYFGYKFDDKFVFNSEIEVEHAKEISLEFAYIDYLYRPWLSFRAGKILMPMGLINELHEPTVYLGAKRPLTEQWLIPSTWGENGAGIFGTISDFNYKAFVVNGFDALGSANGGSADGFSAEKGLREGRQDGGEAKSVSFGGVVRADYVGLPGLLAGLSGYYGKAGQNFSSGITTWIADGHLDYRWGGLLARTVFSYAQVSDVTELYLQQQTGGTLTKNSESVGSSLIGGYVEVGYNILHHFSTAQELITFGRFERIDTQYRQPDSFQRNGAYDQTLYTVGLRYKPILQIAAKAEYQHIRNTAETGVNQFNMSLGYIF